MQMVTQTT